MVSIRNKRHGLRKAFLTNWDFTWASSTLTKSLNYIPLSLSILCSQSGCLNKWCLSEINDVDIAKLFHSNLFSLSFAFICEVNIGIYITVADEIICLNWTQSWRGGGVNSNESWRWVGKMLPEGFLVVLLIKSKGKLIICLYYDVSINTFDFIVIFQN